MSDPQLPGSRSLRELIAAAHRRLDDLFEATRAHLAEGDAADATSSFAKLRQDLEDHFDQEDSLYYPPIGALRPELKETVVGLNEAHEQFRGHFREIATALESAALSDAAAAFEAFAESFAIHEAREESMLAELDTAE